MSVAAVLWDMDGTLVDSEALHFATTLAVLASEGIGAPDGLQALMTGLSAVAAHDLLASEFGLAADYPAFVGRRAEIFLHRAAALKPRPGALAAYGALDARRVPQAVVSNSDRMLVDASLRVIGLQRPDLITVSRNDVRRGKPDPEPYLRAAWLLGVEPAACIVVEDSPTGARAGLAAGMRVLAWPEPGTDAAGFAPGCIAVPDAGALLATLDACLDRPQQIGLGLVSR